LVYEIGRRRVKNGRLFASGLCSLFFGEIL